MEEARKIAETCYALLQQGIRISPRSQKQPSNRIHDIPMSRARLLCSDSAAHSIVLAFTVRRSGRSCTAMHFVQTTLIRVGTARVQNFSM